MVHIVFEELDKIIFTLLVSTLENCHLYVYKMFGATLYFKIPSKT